MPILAPKKGNVDTYRAPLLNNSNKVRLKNTEEYRAYHGEKFKIDDRISDAECEAWKKKHQLVSISEN